MLTIKVKIKSISDLETLNKCVYQSTGLFYKLYNNAELMADKKFRVGLLSNLNMIDVSMYDFTVDDVKTKLSQKATLIRKKTAELEEIEKILANENKNIISNKKRYKLINKKQYLVKGIKSDCCFGGKALLRDITRHSQLANNFKGDLSKKEVEENKNLYEKELKLFREKRKLGFYIIGRASEGGNRKVDFDLINNRIVFKPNKNNHIEIVFADKRKSVLDKLQAYADSGSIPITVRITNTHVCFSYDESILSGFNFEETEYKRTIKKHGITSKEGKKEVAKGFHKQREQKMLLGKIENRFASVDLNPKEISLVIGDRLSLNKGGDFNVLFKQTFSLEKLCEHTGLASDSEEQKIYNEKRKYEIKEVWKQIFIICMHYKVYNFVSEELNFKVNNKKDDNVEFNRQTKNLWHLELTKKLITKWINIYGLKHIEVNPAYSSFIGNLVYNEYDPISASIEILRRGMVKYLKGNSLYPDMSLINQQKLNYLADENIQYQNDSNWISLYKQVTRADKRYRNRDKEIYLRSGINKNLSSYKSKVGILQCL